MAKYSTLSIFGEKDLLLLTESIAVERYTSSRYYQFFFGELVADQAYRWIWKSKCTMKLKVFAWLLLSDRLNTKNMLRRRHYIFALLPVKIFTVSSANISKKRLWNTCLLGAVFLLNDGPLLILFGRLLGIDLKGSLLLSKLGPDPYSWKPSLLLHGPF